MTNLHVHAPAATRAAIGDLADQCENRSLFATRFALPTASDKTTPTRRAWFESMRKKKVPSEIPDAFIPESALLLYARLEYRLMLNMAEGIMENANICMDRYGRIQIPGSAVKGCARRMALQALRDWPTYETAASQDDPTSPCRVGYKSPAEMLAAIACIFGSGEGEWSMDKKDGHWKSDFAWACESPDLISHAAEGHDIPAKGSALGAKATPGLNQEGSLEKVREIMSEALALLDNRKSFAGSVAFLPAYPGKDPGIEVDVLTPHHSKYYAGEKQIATDDEDPTPVLFPTVAPGAIFRFPLVPLSQGGRTFCPQIFISSDPLALARTWLSFGISLLGLGAKTNAGYGWFVITDKEGKPINEGFAITTAQDGIQNQSAPTEHPLVSKWKGKLITKSNFRVALPEIAAITDPDELRMIFQAVIPESERNKIGKNQQYWQAFTSNPSGKTILERLSLKLS